MHEDGIAEFIDLLSRSLEQGSFVRLVLGKYRGPEADLRRVMVRRVSLRNSPMLSFVYRYQTRDVTRNLDTDNAVAAIRELLGTAFRSAHLFALTGDVQLDFNRRGDARVGRGKPTAASPVPEQHDHAKVYPVDHARPFLQALGITDDRDRVLPSMSDKWKQINKFVEVFAHAVESSALQAKAELDVVDFGSGKGYLTFAVHDYLVNVRKVAARVTGVELKRDLVAFCNRAAQDLGAGGLVFQPGDIQSFTPDRMDIMIALHACDTATDSAIHKAIGAKASVIICAPCCQKEIRPQIRPPEILRPLLRSGIHLEREAEMVTDGLRALLMEASGYRTQVFEFISLEHTRKNTMIVGVRGAVPGDAAPVWAQIDAIKAFYGIREQRLETLIRGAAPGVDSGRLQETQAHPEQRPIPRPLP